MVHERQPHQEIRNRLRAARACAQAFTGLYGDEDLADEVLSACDEVLVLAGTSAHLQELRQGLEACCQHLADATNRFSARDPAVIAAARTQLIRAIDQFEEAALAHVKGALPLASRSLLRQRSH